MTILIIRGDVNFRKRKKKRKEESLTREELEKLMK
jgi:hypothetical protein